MTAGIDPPDLEEEEIEAREIAGSSSLGSGSLLAAALVGSGATLIVGALGVVRTKALALGLEPGGLGLYGQILTMLTALSAASGLGLGMGTTRVVAESRTHGDRDRMKTAIDVTFAVPLVISLLIALAVAALAGLLAPWLLDDDRTTLILVAAATVPAVVMQGPSIHALQGFRDVWGVQASNLFFGVVLTVSSIVGVIVAGLDGAVLALGGANLAYAAALAWRLRRVLGEAGVKIAVRAGLRRDHLRSPVVRSMLGIGFASLFVGIATTAGELVVRTFVLHRDGADAAGIFQALQVISVQVLGVIVVSIIFLSFSSVTEAHAAGDRGRVRALIDDTLRLALILVLPVLMALSLFRYEVIEIFLSAGFVDAADLLPAQLVGDVLRTVAFALGAALVPIGMTRRWAAIAVVTVAAYLGSSALLVPAHGLDGAVAAYVLQWAVCAGLTAAVLIRTRVWAPSGSTGRMLLLSLLVVGAALLPALDWPLAALGVVVFGGLVLALGTAQPERAAAYQRVRGALGR